VARDVQLGGIYLGGKLMELSVNNSVRGRAASGRKNGSGEHIVKYRSWYGRAELVLWRYHRQYQAISIMT